MAKYGATLKLSSAQATAKGRITIRFFDNQNRVILEDFRDANLTSQHQAVYGEKLWDYTQSNVSKIHFEFYLFNSSVAYIIDDAFVSVY